MQNLSYPLNVRGLVGFCGKIQVLPTIRRTHVRQGRDARTENDLNLMVKFEKFQLNIKCFQLIYLNVSFFVYFRSFSFSPKCASPIDIFTVANSYRTEIGSFSALIVRSNLFAFTL